MSIDTLTVEKDVVTTKEELEAWKAERAKNRPRGGEPTRPPELDPDPTRKSRDWEDDVNLLVAFLKGLKSLMKYLIDHRVPVEPAQLFASGFPEVEQNINWAISDLYDIVTTAEPKNHPCYVGLQVRGLTEAPLALKMRETEDRVNDSPVPAVLERFDSILGSLFPVLASLEPVREFKEALESRIKHGGDKGLISLNIFRDQARPWITYPSKTGR